MAKNAVGQIITVLVVAVVGYWIYKSVLPKIQSQAATAAAQKNPVVNNNASAGNQATIQGAANALQAIIAAANSGAPAPNVASDAAKEASSGLSAIYYDPNLINGT